MPAIRGLSSAEEAARRQQGKVNRPPSSPTKTVGQIVRDNLCTYFNLVFVVLALMLAAVGSWLNMGFLGVVFCNTVIGIGQQLRAKKTIDELTLVAARKVRCLRDGRWGQCLSEELVQDDVVEFYAGDQIVADAVVLAGSAQVNESLLTGEARPVPKTEGGELRSGSFLMAGHCTARLTRVGDESYASRLTAEAQADGHKVAKGEMMRSLDKLIKGIGLLLVPVGAALLWKQYGVLALDLRSSVESAVAALVGMIPEGLYLLADEPLEEILRSFYGAEEPDNDTGRALKAKFDRPGRRWPVTGRVPFNTAYKYSAKSFGEKGVYVVGAPDVLAGPRSEEFRALLDPLLARGCRVLLLARLDGPLPDPPAALPPERLHFLALLPVQNRIRASAPDTFAYFAGQGVAVKVISGDDPRAVSQVAKQAGIEGADRWVDAAALQDDAALGQAAGQYTVFGRVTPEQKRKLVHALQSGGHTVAMTGDGVNDVLALKDADCGIAMASGAQAASQVAQLVLLDSDFAALPHVVDEGRRVINNIQRSASLFLVKNIFSLLLSLVSLCLPLVYPFQPLQLSLLSAVTIGLPSFVLALEPNYELVRGKFLHNVLHAALPGGLTDFLLVFCAQGFAYAFGLSADALGTISTLLVLETGLIVLFRVCRPFNAVRWALWVGCAVLGLGGAVVLAPLLDLIPLDLGGVLVLAVLAALSMPVLQAMTGLVDGVWRAGRRLKGKYRKTEK